jgi:hypothetical protein
MTGCKRHLSLGCAAGLLAILIGAAAARSEQSQTGADATASAPTSESRPLGNIEIIEDRLRLTDAQAGAYEVARARKWQIDDPVALNLLLRKVSRLPALSPLEMADLDRPAVRNLLRWPGRYAARPMRLRVLVNRVLKWQPGVDFLATPDWTRDDGPIYRYDCLHAEANSPAQEPLCMLSTLEPRATLGKPLREAAGGELIYDLPEIEVAGVFFKVFAGLDVAGRPREYPVVLAWQMRPPPRGDWRGSSQEWGPALLGGMLVLVPIAGYFVWRLRRSAQSFRQARLAARAWSDRNRRRDEEGRQGGTADGGEDLADSELASAAEEFRGKDGRTK